MDVLELLTSSWQVPTSISIIGLVLMASQLTSRVPSINLAYTIFLLGGTLFAIGVNLLAVQLAFVAFGFTATVTLICCGIGLYMSTWKSVPRLFRLGFLGLIALNVLALSIAVSPYWLYTAHATGC